MNSRQLRKKAAAIHNMARHESAAYKEDRIRDPKKYETSKASKRAARQTIGLFAAMTSSINYITNDSIVRRTR